ncbi:hypothetical protein B0H19DRAFT_1187410 [Mycena capillaripes]|nr:hypothetical protein B0H19DRAFT_1187410 [Mycena capillaripes]
MDSCTATRSPQSESPALPTFAALHRSLTSVDTWRTQPTCHCQVILVRTPSHSISALSGPFKLCIISALPYFDGIV